MRVLLSIILMAVLAAAGCARKVYDGPTVKAFVGKVTRLGQPVSFPQGEDVSLTVFHEKGHSFGIPLKPDGSFKIGWMPIGKYSVMLNRAPKSVKRGPMKYNVPGGLTIEEGKTEYTIDLGRGYRS